MMIMVVFVFAHGGAKQCKNEILVVALASVVVVVKWWCVFLSNVYYDYYYYDYYYWLGTRQLYVPSREKKDNLEPCAFTTTLLKQTRVHR